MTAAPHVFALFGIGARVELAGAAFRVTIEGRGIHCVIVGVNRSSCLPSRRDAPK
jgi:hypothetical protein